MGREVARPQQVYAGYGGTRGVADEKVAALKITAAYLNKGRTNVGDTSGNRLRATAVNEHNLADGAISQNFLAAKIGIRMQPWLAGRAGTTGPP